MAKQGKETAPISMQRVFLVSFVLMAIVHVAIFHAYFQVHADLSVQRLLALPSKDEFLRRATYSLQGSQTLETQTGVSTIDSNGLIEQEEEGHGTSLVGVVSHLRQKQTPILPNTEINTHGYPRAFDPWPRQVTLPCFPPEKKKMYHRAVSPPTTTDGFLFMKLMKAGGSTAAGIHLRIMRQIARDRKEEFDFCRGRFEHAWGHEVMEKKSEEPLKSFAWTIVREPTRRAVSQFFHFQVSREAVEPTDYNFQKYLKSERRIVRHFYLQVLNSERIYPSTKITNDMAPRVISKIFNEYNFIGVTERMEETAVCLMMLLDLKMSTILYLDAKKNGAFDDGGHGKCTWIQGSRISHGMEQYFKRRDWVQLVKWDEVFYKAANDSLDMTIDRLGRAKFAENLAKFRKARQLANERCLEAEVFPCTSSGERNRHSDCLWKDSGCGVSCLDQIASELGL